MLLGQLPAPPRTDQRLAPLRDRPSHVPSQCSCVSSSAQVLKEEDCVLAFPVSFSPPPQLPEWVTVDDICSDNRLLVKFGAFFFFNVTVT